MINRPALAAPLVAVASLALPVVAAQAAADTAGGVQLASDVFVEKFVPGPGGRVSRVLERPAALRAGDRLVFVVNWKGRRTREFTVSNPLPRAVAWQRSADMDEEVSIDRGRTWGQLEDLRVREADGSVRHALPEDVTHVRWRVPQQLALNGAGQITYRGVVR